MTIIFTLILLNIINMRKMPFNTNFNTKANIEISK